MRLTLRTLLAYLDDILEPAQTKEIGEKISESGFASSLTRRIRDVMRRRRLTAPELDGPGSGIDPNTVAEYLDNVLPPNKVADVEKVCLESDVHLAEVGACHQILTIALGEPVQIGPKTRESMYALGPLGESRGERGGGDGRGEKVATVTSEPSSAGSGPGEEPPDRRAPVPVAAPSFAEQSRMAPPDRSAGESFADTIPDYLKTKPWWRRALPYAVVGTIAAVWIALLAYGPPLNLSSSDGDNDGRQASRGPADEQPGDQLAANGDAVESPPGRQPAEAESAEAESEESAAAATQTQQPQSPAVTSIDPPPPPDEPEQGVRIVDDNPPTELPLPVEPKLATDAGDPEPPQVAANPPAEAVEAEIDDRPAAEQPVPPVQGPPLKYVSKDGIFLRYDDEEQDWLILPTDTTIGAGQRLACPEPFEAALDIGNAAAKATLLGGTAVGVLPPSQAAPLGLEIDQGRLILQRQQQPAAEQADPLTLALSAGKDLWRLELLTPGTRCGIEITLLQPSQPDQVLAPNNYSGALYVASGSVRLADGNGEVTVVGEKDWLSLTPAGGQETADEPAPEKPPLLTIPEWLDPEAPQTTLTWRRFADLFEEEFFVGDPAKPLPLSENVPPMIKHDRAYISALAVKCLALVGDYESLATALNAEHEESRLAAIAGLRNWLPTDEDNGKRLQEVLGRQFPEEEAETIARLLWGYSKQDARDPDVSRRLVDLLRHNNVVIRELAFHHIYRLTGRKYDYHPMRSATQRESAIRRWEYLLEKQQGTLIQE